MVLPHKIHEEEKFFEECKKFKDRFNSDHEKSVFQKDGIKNTPIDGLPAFIKSTWDIIKDQKELNLPD